MLFLKDNILVLNTSELRLKFTSVIESVVKNSEQVLITHKKEPFVFLMPFKYYEKFQQFLEAEKRKEAQGPSLNEELASR